MMVMMPIPLRDHLQKILVLCHENPISLHMPSVGKAHPEGAQILGKVARIHVKNKLSGKTSEAHTINQYKRHKHAS